MLEHLEYYGISQYPILNMQKNVSQEALNGKS